jgi:hypothetical protein
VIKLYHLAPGVFENPGETIYVERWNIHIFRKRFRFSLCNAIFIFPIYNAASIASVALASSMPVRSAEGKNGFPKTSWHFPSNTLLPFDKGASQGSIIDGMHLKVQKV